MPSEFYLDDGVWRCRPRYKKKALKTSTQPKKAKQQPKKIHWQSLEEKRIRSIVRGQNHRARKAEALGIVSYEQWIEMLDQYKHRCVKCKRPNRICMDHILGLNLGGEHSISNIQPLCVSCNTAKGSRTDDWRTNA